MEENVGRVGVGGVDCVAVDGVKGGADGDGGGARVVGDGAGEGECFESVNGVSRVGEPHISMVPSCWVYNSLSNWVERVEGLYFFKDIAG